MNRIIEDARTKFTVRTITSSADIENRTASTREIANCVYTFFTTITTSSVTTIYIRFFTFVDICEKKKKKNEEYSLCCWTCSLQQGTY